MIGINRRQPDEYSSKYDMVSKKKAKRRIKASIVNKVTTIALAVCSVILLSTGILGFLTKDTIEPNKAKLEGKYGHMEIAKIDEIPENLKNAVVSIEDKRFYSHKGVDFLGLGRAFVKNIFKGSLEGGSTLEMQISKNLMTSQEKSFKRKLQDIKTAYEMNKNMSKEDILEVYLNSIYLGGGATGVKAGARIYFAKDISELNLAECALLAGITKHPSKYMAYISKPITLKDTKKDLENKLVFSYVDDTNKSLVVKENIIEKLKSMNLLTDAQYEDLKAGTMTVQKAELNPNAIERQKVVLEAMKSNRVISKKEYEEALNTPIVINTSLK